MEIGRNGQNRTKTVEIDRKRTQTVKIGRKLSKMAKNGRNRLKTNEIGKKWTKQSNSLWVVPVVIDLEVVVVGRLNASEDEEDLTWEMKL
nr:hypothetical protein [Tanacetum cinerariifolium]